MKQLPRLSVAVAAATLLFSVSAQSQAAGKHTVKAGYAYSDFENDSGDLYNPDPTGTAIPAGITAGAKNMGSVMLTYDYHFTDNFALELAVGLPPTVKLEAFDHGTELGEVGEARSLAPTILITYTQELGAGWNAYGGLGINYTKLDRVEVYESYTRTLLTAAVGPALADALIANGQATSEGEIDDSVGAAVKLGVTYNFTPNWMVDVSYSWYDVSADITNTMTVLGTPMKQSLTIDADPSLYGIAVGYTF